MASSYIKEAKFCRGNAIFVGKSKKEKKCIRWNCLNIAPNAVRLPLW